MNTDLKVAIEEFSDAIKTTRPNYIACYNSFLSYCNSNLNYGMSELFEKITLFHIEQACKEYFISSKKAEKVESIRRFLSAIDMFYSDYLVPRRMYCRTLENKCRHKEVIHRICQSLNHDFNQKIFLPLEDKDMEKSLQLIAELDDSNFFQLGQKIIFKLLITYGFKEQIIIRMPIDAFDLREHTLTVYSQEDLPIVLELPKTLCEDIKTYIDINPFSNRKYLFTKKNGKQLDSSSTLQILKPKAEKLGITNFTPTSVALSGIVNLINRNLTIGEIIKLSGFEMKKIADVADYLLIDKDISQLINKKTKDNSEICQ